MLKKSDTLLYCRYETFSHLRHLFLVRSVVATLTTKNILARNYLYVLYMDGQIKVPSIVKNKPQKFYDQNQNCFTCLWVINNMPKINITFERRLLCQIICSGDNVLSSNFLVWQVSLWFTQFIVSLFERYEVITTNNTTPSKIRYRI